MILKNYIFIFLFFTSFNIYGQTIKTVSFEGLTHTNKDYLNRLIKCKTGVKYDSLIVANDVQTLKNLNLFFNVTSKVIFNLPDSTYNITFIIKEAKYVFPLISISGFKDVLKIQAGINHINWKGENKTIGFLYQYYDRHSISFYQKTPRHKKGKTGHSFSLSKYSTIEPLYFKQNKSFFNFDNYSIALNGFYWLKPTINIEIGGQLMYEIYVQRDSVDIELQNMQFDFFKYQIKSALNFNKINYNFERLSGIKYQFYSELIETYHYPMASFLKFISDFKFYKSINKRVNLAFYHRFGIATNNLSPFSPFVIDGFLNIRGVGNRIERGTAEHIINLEYRCKLLDKKYFTIQSVVFLDYGSIRDAGQSINQIFDLKNDYNYSGIGIRLHSKFFYKSIFRLDFGINLQNANQHGFSFGVGQFF
jgi:outer membrane protein assembly factor BamA